MKTIQVEAYEARDGKRFLDVVAAQNHERYLDHAAVIEDIMRPLGDRVSGDGYKQRDRDTCEHAAAGLLKAFGSWQPSWLHSHVAPAIAHGAFACRRGIIGRIISDCDDQLWSAWSRIGCIDDQYREWEQPYYAIHGGKMVEQK